MSSPKNFASGFAATVLLIALSGCATNAQRQLSAVDATCKQAQSDTNFLRQFAACDGGGNPDLDAAVLRTCNTIGATSAIGSGTS